MFPRPKKKKGSDQNNKSLKLLPRKPWQTGNIDWTDLGTCGRCRILPIMTNERGQTH